jgi:hypothetical protein
MPMLTARVREWGLSPLALLAALSLGACGEGGGGGGQNPGADRAAVERAAISYIEETTSDEDDAENASALDVTDVKVDGDSAEAKASSSATGNKYEVTLARAGGSWQGRTLLTDRPSQESSGGGDPASGPGQKVSGSVIEAEVKKQLLTPLKIRGSLKCPSRVALRRGNNFECKLTGARSGTVQVTQKNDRGSLNFKINLKAG